MHILLLYYVYIIMFTLYFILLYITLYIFTLHIIIYILFSWIQLHTQTLTHARTCTNIINTINKNILTCERLVLLYFKILCLCVTITSQWSSDERIVRCALNLYMMNFYYNKPLKSILNYIYVLYSHNSSVTFHKSASNE